MSQTSTSTKTAIRTKFPSMWRVVLHNDDFTPFGFVIELLQLIFNKSSQDAQALASVVHEKGAAHVGLFTKEIAITKASIVISTAEKYGYPLYASAEEA